MNVFDLLLNEDLDLRIERGDMVVGESTLQHQGLLLLSHQGDWRVDGTVGIALNNELLDDASPDELRQRIRKDFERDGMQVGRIEITDSMPLIEAIYE